MLVKSDILGKPREADILVKPDKTDIWDESGRSDMSDTTRQKSPFTKGSRSVPRFFQNGPLRKGQILCHVFMTRALQTSQSHDCRHNQRVAS